MDRRLSLRTMGGGNIGEHHFGDYTLNIKAMKYELIKLLDKLDKDSLAQFAVFWFGDDPLQAMLELNIERCKDEEAIKEGIRHIKMNYEIN